MRAEHTLALHKHKCSYTHTHSPSHTPLRALIHSYAHVHPHTRGFKCCRAFIVIVFTKVWRAAERLSKSKHRGYNEYVGVHYGRKSTQEERTCWRSIGACVFKCCVVIGETASPHFLYENTAKSQLSVLCSLDKVVWYTSYKTLNISPRALAAYLFGCVLWSCSSSYPSNLIILVYPVCLQLMPYPCSERPGSGVHENSWRRTDWTQGNHTNPSLLCPDQVTFLFFFFFFSFLVLFVRNMNIRINKKTDKWITSVQSVSLGDEAKQKQKCCKYFHSNMKIVIKYGCSSAVVLKAYY